MEAKPNRQGRRDLLTPAISKMETIMLKKSHKIGSHTRPEDLCLGQGAALPLLAATGLYAITKWK
jgi:hypothetical protein